MTQPQRVRPVPLADGRARLRHVFVRDLELQCRIGVHRHERRRDQRVLVTLDLAVREGEAPAKDSLDSVVCYEKIVERVRAIARDGHVNLLETLAERIARACCEDRRVRTVRVRVEKPDAFSDAASVGVEIERFNGP